MVGKNVRLAELSLVFILDSLSFGKVLFVGQAFKMVLVYAMV